MEILYQEHSLKDVTDYFAKGFEEKDNRKVVRWEAFVIPDQKKVIFKLFVEPVIAVSRGEPMPAGGPQGSDEA